MDEDDIFGAIEENKRNKENLKDLIQTYSGFKPFENSEKQNTLQFQFPKIAVYSKSEIVINYSRIQDSDKLLNILNKFCHDMVEILNEELEIEKKTGKELKKELYEKDDS